MVDRISKEKRKWNMSRIKCKDTAIEVAVRSFLFKNGFRFRKNVKELPGKPDIVLKKYHTVIFINGCFWHHHENCNLAVIPKTNTAFWVNKFRKNIENDKNTRNKLIENGWNVITIWECQLKNNIEEYMNNIISILKTRD